MKELQYPFDEKLILRKQNQFLNYLQQHVEDARPVRIAVLSDSTSQLVTKLLSLFLLNEGIRASFFCGTNGNSLDQIIYRTQELIDFQPEIIYCHTGIRDLNVPGEELITESGLPKLVDQYIRRWHSLWSSVSACRAQIIQNNFEFPLVRDRGNYDGAGAWGLTNLVMRLNEALQHAAEDAAGLHILDVNYLSAHYGLMRWASPNCWYEAKIWPSLTATVFLAYSLSRLIASMIFGSKKLIVTDLDNTLWSGAIADVGVAGINMAPESAAGEAHRELQRWLLRMKEAGVLIAVASKNDRDDALAGLNHPDCLMSPNDFVQIEANWNSKDDSIRRICDQLNLLPQSVVFLDDNETERLLVERNVPGVTAVPFSHVEELLPAISAAQLFQIDSVTEEDAKRTEMYQSSMRQAIARQSFESYDQFLQGLRLSAEIFPTGPESLTRMLQLLRKTNRFRLSPRGFSEQQLLEMISRADYMVDCVLLRDRIMDYGAVSFVLARDQDGRLCILQWVLSCRAFQRGLEYAIMDHIVAYAKVRKLREITAVYQDAGKNGMVLEVLRNCGFQPPSDEDGCWKLLISKYTPQCYCIEIKEQRCQDGSK